MTMIHSRIHVLMPSFSILLSPGVLLLAYMLIAGVLSDSRHLNTLDNLARPHDVGSLNLPKKRLIQGDNLTSIPYQCSPICPEVPANTSIAQAQTFWDKTAVISPAGGYHCKGRNDKTTFRFYIRLDVLAAMTTDSSSNKMCYQNSMPGCGAGHNYLVVRLTCKRKFHWGRLTYSSNHAEAVVRLDAATKEAGIVGQNTTAIIRQNRGAHMAHLDVQVGTCGDNVEGIEVGFSREADKKSFASLGRMSIDIKCESWQETLGLVINNVAPCFGCTSTVGQAPDCLKCGPTVGSISKPALMSVTGNVLYYVV